MPFFGFFSKKTATVVDVKVPKVPEVPKVPVEVPEVPVDARAIAREKALAKARRISHAKGPQN